MIGNFLRISKLRRNGWIIEQGVTIQKGAQLKAEKGIIRKNSFIGANCKIAAKSVEIDENCLLYPDLDILVSDTFKLGKRSKISRRVTIRAHYVDIGEEFWCNENVEIGGGGWMKPSARLTVGNHVHMGKGCSVNVCEPVTIGSCTGIGIECMIFTHSSGNGQSILEGYKHIEAPVNIGSHVSLFTRVMVAPGSVIHDGATLGAMSYVVGEVNSNCLYAGIPAKEKKHVYPVESSAKIDVLVNALEKELSSPVDQEIKNESSSDVFVVRTLNENLLNTLKHKGYKVVVCFEASVNSSDLTNIAIFCIGNGVVKGKSSVASETVRDALRRNGLLFNYDKSYVPQKLDAVLLYKKGIELM